MTLPEKPASIYPNKEVAQEEGRIIVLCTHFHMQRQIIVSVMMQVLSLVLSMNVCMHDGCILRGKNVDFR